MDAEDKNTNSKKTECKNTSSMPKKRGRPKSSGNPDPVSSDARVFFLFKENLEEFDTAQAHR